MRTEMDVSAILGNEGHSGVPGVLAARLSALEAEVRQVYEQVRTLSESLLVRVADSAMILAAR